MQPLPVSPLLAAAASVATATDLPSARSVQASAVSADFNPWIAQQRRDDFLVQGLVKAPDGTLYRVGGGLNGAPGLGSEPAPYYVYRMSPNGLWVPIDYAYSFAIGHDSTLYFLDTDHVLRTPALGPTHWRTLATDVKSMFVTKEGDLFALRSSGEMLVQRHGATSLSPFATGITSLMQSPGGKIYALNDRQELLQLVGASQWKLLDRGVGTMSMTSDGSLYEVNDKGELKRLSDGKSAKVLAREVMAFQVAPDGGVYALDEHARFDEADCARSLDSH